MKKLLFVTIFSMWLIKADIIVRPAVIQELDAILELDRRVTFEFFYPLYLSLFNHLHISKDPRKELEIELSIERQSFPEYIKALGDYRLYIAWDDVQNIPAGLLTFHKENHIVQLDLLLVDAAYRNKGIGKKLVYSALKAFAMIKECIVYPFQYNNDNTLNFYKALGFKNMGFGPSNKYTNYNVSYSEIYYCLKFDVSNSVHLPC